MMTLYDFHGGVHPPENKHTSHAAIETLPLAPFYAISLLQSSGQAARLRVAVGDEVKKGQILAQANGALSVAVHAPTSGIVRAIEALPLTHAANLPDLGILLEADGKDTWGERTPLAWQEASDAAFLQHLQDHGVVGLGGALFPTHLKTRAKPLETLIINAAECEPYITCDDRLMQERATEIVHGVQILQHRTQAKQSLIAIEDNKPEAIAIMRQACANTPCQVVVIPTKYPSGSAKQLIQILTGKKVPQGARSTDFGVQCVNVATAYSVYVACVLGEPQISRVVTLTGNVARAGNFEMLIGTPVDFALQHVGAPAHCATQDIIVGGPMMGFALGNLSAGLTKTCNCLIVKDAQNFPERAAALPCIRCGSCIEACPAELQPLDLYWFAKSKQFDRARDYDLFSCIECGACSYVCPSQIPLVDYYRFAKSECRALDADKRMADLARIRHDFRQFRIEREKAEKAARLAAKAAASAAKAKASSSSEEEEKRAKIQAAMERAKAKKTAKATQDQST